MPIPSSRGLCATAPNSRPKRPRSAKCRSEEHTSELQSRQYLVCRLLLEKKNYYLKLASPTSYGCRCSVTIYFIFPHPYSLFSPPITPQFLQYYFIDHVYINALILLTLSL